MKQIVQKYKLCLVRENEFEYEYENINSPEDVYETALKLKMEDEPEEVVYLFCLDKKGKITSFFELSRGSLGESIVHPREVFKRAILANANSLVLAHNHPSGDSEPSSQDVHLTKRMMEAGKLIGIELVDHIIVGYKQFSSLKRLGYL